MTKVLVIEAKQARYLYETERFTKQDPYMNVWTTSTSDPDHIKKTRVNCNGGKEAVWGDTFRIDVDNVAKEHFFLEVMDHNDLCAHRLIGKAKFACSDLGTAPVEAWIKIYRDNGMDAGEVLVKAHIE